MNYVTSIVGFCIGPGTIRIRSGQALRDLIPAFTFNIDVFRSQVTFDGRARLRVALGDDPGFGFFDRDADVIQSGSHGAI